MAECSVEFFRVPKGKWHAKDRKVNPDWSDGGGVDNRGRVALCGFVQAWERADMHNVLCLMLRHTTEGFCRKCLVKLALEGSRS